MTIALAIDDSFSVITLGRGAPSVAPAWSRLLDWPERGNDDISFAASDVRSRAHAAARLDCAVRLAMKPVIIVAEGAACFAAAWWARLTPEHEVRRVSGALFFAPLSGGPLDELATRSAFDSPDVPLPFPALLFDPDWKHPERRAALDGLAGEWGGAVAGPPRLLARQTERRSHWRQAQDIVGRYTARVVKRDIRLAHHRVR